MRQLVSLLLTLNLIGCVTTEYGVGTHTEDLFFYSSEKEVLVGKSISKQIPLQLDVSKNPKDLKRLRDIGDRVALVCDRGEIDYYFYVIEDEQMNAFALPGGYVYIYKELMDELTDDELAFVVAHEVGHIVSRHAIKRMQAQMGMNLLVLASSQVESTSDFQHGLMLALGQMTAAYSREDELNADQLAVKYLELIGIDASVGIGVMEKLYQAQKGEPLRPMQYFKTHPFIPHRIKGIKESLGMPLSFKDYLN